LGPVIRRQVAPPEVMRDEWLVVTDRCDERAPLFLIARLLQHRSEALRNREIPAGWQIGFRRCHDEQRPLVFREALVRRRELVNGVPALRLERRIHEEDEIAEA